MVLNERAYSAWKGFHHQGLPYLYASTHRVRGRSRTLEQAFTEASSSTYGHVQFEEETRECVDLGCSVVGP
jgi:hypothetical protein